MRKKRHRSTILPRMHRRLHRVVVLAVASLASAPPLALADGSPPTDVLLKEDVYFPYSPPVSDPYGPRLRDLLRDARKAGYPIKVALIQTQADLGAYSAMFGNQQEFANLLYSSLPAPGKPQHGVEPGQQLRLLVVMPTGFGGNNLGGRVNEALEGIEVDRDAESDGLARAALEAVPRLAAEEGIPLEVAPPAATAAPEEPGRDEGGGPGTGAVVIASILVLLGAAFGARAVSRRSGGRPDRDDPPAPPDDPTRN